MNQDPKFKIAPIKGIDEQKGTIDFTLTSKTIDRDGEVVLPMGVNLENFRKNPVFLWAHSRRDPSIGRVIPETIRQTDNDITATVEFDLDDPFAKLIFGKFKKKHLNAGSISFIPKQFDKPVLEGQTGSTFTESELLEFSAVPIPSNPQALAKEYSGQKGGWLEVLKAFYEQEPEGGPGEWCKFLEERKPGKINLTELPEMNYTEGYCKSLDVKNEYLETSILEYEWASRFCDCQVKELYVTSTGISDLWRGSFYNSFQFKTAEWKLHDVRKLTSGGKEEPPLHEVLRLNSKESITVLSEGIAFWDAYFGKFLTKFRKTWDGTQLIIYSHQRNRNQANEFINKVWQFAAENHKMKGEAFSLSGDFLKRGSITWDDIFIKQKNRDPLVRMVKSINERRETLRNRGLILMGPPGTGKTLSGKVIMNEAQTTFVWISAKDFMRKGVSGGLIESFELAKTLAPTILFVEDIDNWLSSHAIDLLKTEMDGVNQFSGVVTILTTNYPERMPDALIDRPGRFHDVLEFNLPEIEERKQMFFKWLPEVINKIFIDEFSKKVNGFSGAHIYELCEFAKVLSDEKSIPIEEALIEALVKIEGQRELLSDDQIAGRRYYPKKGFEMLTIDKEVEDSPGKGAVSYSQTQTAEKESPWDGNGARNRIAKWASSDGSGNTDKISWPKYRRAFAWFDGEKAESFGSYKLPFKDVIDGELKTIWRGVTAAMGSLLGARGGSKIPEDDRRKVYNLLAKYYKDFEETPPEFKNYTEAAEAMINILNDDEKTFEEKQTEYSELSAYYKQLGLKAPELPKGDENLTTEEMLELYESEIIKQTVMLLQGGSKDGQGNQKQSARISG